MLLQDRNQLIVLDELVKRVAGHAVEHLHHLVLHVLRVTTLPLTHEHRFVAHAIFPHMQQTLHRSIRLLVEFAVGNLPILDQGNTSIVVLSTRQKNA